VKILEMELSFPERAHRPIRGSGADPPVTARGRGPGMEIRYNPFTPSSLGTLKVRGQGGQRAMSFDLGEGDWLERVVNVAWVAAPLTPPPLPPHPLPTDPP